MSSIMNYQNNEPNAKRQQLYTNTHIPFEIKYSIIKMMDFKTIIKTLLYCDEFNTVINDFINNIDKYIYDNLSKYKINTNDINIFIKHKHLILRFIKYIEKKETGCASVHISKMTDEQYIKFEYLYDNGFDFMVADHASKYYTNIQINEMVIMNNNINIINISKLHIMKSIKAFNNEQMKQFIDLCKIGFRDFIAFEVINNNINNINNNIINIINLFKLGCPDYITIQVAKYFSEFYYNMMIDYINKGINAESAYKDVYRMQYIKNKTILI
jgi:hypothetical protein